MASINSTEESQLNVQGYNIVTILKRLEAATSRLEDVSIFQEEAALSASRAAKPAPKSAPKTAPAAPLAPKSPETSPENPFVAAFRNLVQNDVLPFVALSADVDPLVGQAAEQFHQGFLEECKFLELVGKAQKPAPTDAIFAKLLEPLNKAIEAINALKDGNRKSAYFNHLNTVSEGAAVLGWVVSPTPALYVGDIAESAQFWLNRVRKEHKEQAAWVKALLDLFDALRLYVKEHHATGPLWNAKGKPLAEVLAGASSAPAPPPPPPAGLFDEPPQAAGPGGSGAGMGAVFADLNKGENVTSGLRKVDKSQMTHKNPALREKRPPPPKKPQSLAAKPPAAKPKKSPRMELVDTKWIIEHYTSLDVSGPLTVEVTMQQLVFIGNTDGVTVQIKGKGNAVLVLETRNTGIVVDLLISGVDVIKSFKFGVQVTGKVPLITVDKLDEGSIYLSAASVEAEAPVVTSNSTAINVNVPSEDDFAELSVPEQLKHYVRDGKLVSEVVEHAG